MNLQVREAEFRHICDIAQLWTDLENPGAEASIELFDSLDCLPAEELAEVVAIYIIGQENSLKSYSEAHQRALCIGFEGVARLHATPQLGQILLQGIQRLEQESPVCWQD